MTTHDDSTPGPGRVWLIGGCSSGFGHALAEAALERGDRVVATARRLEALADLTGARVLLAELAVTRGEHVDAAVHSAIDRFGRIDVLVNNAGYGSIGGFEAIDINRRRRSDRHRRPARAYGHHVLRRGRTHSGRAATHAPASARRDRADQLAGRPGRVRRRRRLLRGEVRAGRTLRGLASEVAPLGIRTLIVERGQFRAGFGGVRMHRSREIGAYADTVRPTRASVDGMDGTQPGDPRKAAAGIIAALHAPEPPLRLALGARSTAFAPSTNGSAPTSTAGKHCHATQGSISRAVRRRSRPIPRCWW